MTALGLVLLAIPIALLLYAAVLYPGLLWLMTRGRKPGIPSGDPPEWPMITISLPAYNEERALAATLESLLALDYPTDKRKILVISDASTDGTDAIVRGFAGRDVELLRVPERGGKTAAENAGSARLEGSIVVNTDATIRMRPESLKSLVRAFQDPSIGVASGRDVSVTHLDVEENQAESTYVDYEMWVRSLETRLGSIVGASGCCYAIRRELVDRDFPASLSRDFAAAMLAVERGLRAVSVHEAICLVPRARGLQAEYRRKVRTMERGLETLWYKRHLMVSLTNPAFSFALVSHKLIRWLVFLTAPLSLVGLAILATRSILALFALILAGFGLWLAIIAIRWAPQRPLPRLLAFPGFAGSGFIAGFMAWMAALRGARNPIWEPTRRH